MLMLQVYVSGKRTSTIPDGYTSSIAEFNGIIDLRPWLRIGNNRISIATLSSKCTASPVRLLLRKLSLPIHVKQQCCHMG